MTDWIDVSAVDEMAAEDVMRFETGWQSYGCYQATNGTFHATEGLRTHEQEHLAEGPNTMADPPCELVPLRAPVRVALRCHKVRVAGGRVQLDIS